MLFLMACEHSSAGTPWSVVCDANYCASPPLEYSEYAYSKFLLGISFNCKPIIIFKDRLSAQFCQENTLSTGCLKNDATFIGIYFYISTSTGMHLTYAIGEINIFQGSAIETTPTPTLLPWLPWKQIC